MYPFCGGFSTGQRLTAERSWVRAGGAAAQPRQRGWRLELGGSSSHGRPLTLDADAELAAGSVVSLVVGGVADHMLSFGEFRAGLRAPQHHPDPTDGFSISTRGRGTRHGLQPRLAVPAAPLPSPLDDTVSRVPHAGRVPVDGGSQLAWLCYALPGLWAADLGRLQICQREERDSWNLWLSLAEL